MSEWIVDRRPKEIGEYVVTLEYTFEAGRHHRFVGTRYYARPGEFPAWTMEGEDVNQMHWTGEGMFTPYGRVVAWTPVLNARWPEPYEL